MRILIADDSAPVRSAIRRLLNEEPGFEIVGEACNLGELVRQVRSLLPELILLDWELSGLPGSTKLPLEPLPPLNKMDKRRNVILASLRSYPSDPRIIVLSSRPEAEAPALAAGADAFVYKGGPPDSLLRSIKLVC